MTQPDQTLPGDLPYYPHVVPMPTGSDLATHLSLDNPSSGQVDAFDVVMVEAGDYLLSRLSYDLLRAAGATPPDTVPADVAKAVTMYGAVLWRRRNSVNGYDGYDDLGTVPVRGNDPNVEQLVDPYRAWNYA